MAYTKPGNTRTARASNNDITGTFYVADGYAPTPNAPRIKVSVISDHADGQTVEYWDIAIDDSASLTPTQKNALKNYLKMLRDEALAALGYVNS